MSKYIDIISLGAGVQSSTLLMMADKGEIVIDGEVVIPKYAIMSDTGNEPKKVYEWLEFLCSQVKNIEIIVTNNGSIIDQTINGILNNKRFASVPFFAKTLDGKKGQLWRQCTSEYKIIAVRKAIRKILGYESRDKIKENIRLWMGISTDEIIRMKPSGVGYITNTFPLIDHDMSRLDCLNWFQNNNLPLPPKSSCVICPYHSNEYWRNIKENDAEAWNMAVDFDKQIRKFPRLDAEIFLHSQRVPLDEVDLNENQMELDLFNNECEGMCGL